jgi:Sec-independent protein secretion pathway component TatC
MLALVYFAPWFALVLVRLVRPGLYARSGSPGKKSPGKK